MDRNDTYKLIRGLIPTGVEHTILNSRPLVESEEDVRSEMSNSREEFNGWFTNEVPDGIEEASSSQKPRKFDPLDGLAVQEQAGSTGIILWEGESRFVPGEPIVAILTFGSANVKTGDMHQVWIMRSDMSPREACSSGADEAVCGSCAFRPSVTPENPEDDPAQCYVSTYRMGGMYDAYKRGSYPKYDSDPDFYDALLKGGLIRWGAYGEPVLIPLKLVQHLTRLSSHWTGYTHAWKDDFADPFKNYFMASVNDEEEYYEAVGRGWRTFRVRGFDSPLLPGEKICPASIEFELSKGVEVECRDCLICGGLGGKGSGNIADIVHGSAKGRGIPSSDVPTAWKQSPSKWDPGSWEKSREALQKLDDMLGGSLLQAPDQSSQFMRPVEEPLSSVGKRLVKLRELLIKRRSAYAKKNAAFQSVQAELLQAETDADDERSNELKKKSEKLDKEIDRLRKAVDELTAKVDETKDLRRERFMQTRESLRTPLTLSQVDQIMTEASRPRRVPAE